MGLILDRRRVMGSTSLPYDAEIEYLELKGASINTGYVPQDYNVSVSTKIRLLGYLSNTEWAGWFSAYTGQDYNAYRVIRYNQENNRIHVNFGIRAGSSSGRQYEITNDTDYVFNMWASCTQINGVDYTSGDIGIQNTSSFKLGAPAFWGRFYYFKVFKNNGIVLDLIPVRVGQTGYMYDKVSGQLFGNSGTGDFILGNDI